MTRGAAKLAIVGGGLAGGMIALALQRLRPDLPFVLIEQRDRFGGGPVAPFFTATVGAGGRWLIEPLIVALWDRYYVAAPALLRTCESRIAHLVPEQIHAELVEQAGAAELRPGTRVAHLDAGGALLADGTMIAADLIVDARGGPPPPAAGRPAVRIVSRLFRFREPHGLDCPILVDATIDVPGWCFLQYFPLTPDCLAIRYLGFAPDGAPPGVEDRSGHYEGGALIHESAETYPLHAGDPPVAPAANCFGVDPGRVGGRHPILWSPVAGAVRLAVEIARAPRLDASHLAARMARLEARAEASRVRHAPLIQRLGSGEPAERHAALRALYGAGDAALLRMETGMSSPSDLEALARRLRAAPGA